MEKGKREVVVSALQFACTDDAATNIATAERLVRAAHSKGANIILIQELFEGYYFCQAQREDFIQRAKPCNNHPTILRMQKLAKELGVVIPVSFFEEANNAHYNSIAIIDADGADLGLYRKSHIPDGPGYQEKFYFNPGDTGFKVFRTKFAKIGVAICWDQWFPEAARALVLQGAEILFYPTAIGSEPQDGGLDSRDHWRRVMQGHAGANLVPVVTSNRIGKEIIETEHGKSEITFYGNSFIAGPTGEIVAAANDKEEAVLVAEFNLDKIKCKRHSWGVFRDRRPELYKFRGYIEPNPLVPHFEGIGINNVTCLQETQKFRDLMWPHGKPKFCEITDLFAELLGNLERIVEKMLFESFGIPQEQYESLTTSNSHLLRFFRYTMPEDSDTVIRFPTHTDKNWTSILAQHDMGGLEVKTKDGEWISVESAPSQFTFMAADGLQVWSNDRIKACHHRVKHGEDKTRYSLGMFTFNNEVFQVPKEMVDESHPLLYNQFDSRGFLRFYGTEEAKKAESPIKAYCGVKN